MSSVTNSRARAVADLAEGSILASVEIAAPPERVFRALSSKEIVEWWVRPGVFDTREWTGDVRVGGRWRASGMAYGQPYCSKVNFSKSIPRASWCTPGTGAARRAPRRR
jgi:activator of Hsp90 ATPase-like protein